MGHVWINVPALKQKQTITDIQIGVRGHLALKLVALDGAFAPESVNAKGLVVSVEMRN